MLKLTLNWRLSLFTALLLPVLVTLGFWQLARADEKRELLAQRQQQRAEPPYVMSRLPSQPLETYQKIRVEAAFLPKQYWLLEARIYQGRPGYEVFMPARLASGELIVVNLALDEDHPSAFVVQSKAVNMPPEKHQGYAVQWFSLAFALCVLWLVTNTNLFSRYFHRPPGEKK